MSNYRKSKAFRSKTTYRGSASAAPQFFVREPIAPPAAQTLQGTAGNYRKSKAYRTSATYQGRILGPATQAFKAEEATLPGGRTVTRILIK